MKKNTKKERKKKNHTLISLQMKMRREKIRQIHKVC
jgi:hypothetical protein